MLRQLYPHVQLWGELVESTNSRQVEAATRHPLLHHLRPRPRPPVPPVVFEAGAGAFGMTILLPALALLVLGLLWIVVYCGRAERAGAHHPAPGSWTWSASKSCAVMQELSKAKGREAAIVCSSGSCDAASSQGLALSLPI